MGKFVLETAVLSQTPPKQSQGYEHVYCSITGVLGKKSWDLFCPLTEVITLCLPCVFVYYFPLTVLKLHVVSTIQGHIKSCYRVIKLMDISPPT